MGALVEKWEQLTSIPTVLSPAKSNVEQATPTITRPSTSTSSSKPLPVYGETNGMEDPHTITITNVNRMQKRRGSTGALVKKTKTKRESSGSSAESVTTTTTKTKGPSLPPLSPVKHRHKQERSSPPSALTSTGAPPFLMLETAMEKKGRSKRAAKTKAASEPKLNISQALRGTILASSSSSEESWSTISRRLIVVVLAGAMVAAAAAAAAAPPTNVSGCKRRNMICVCEANCGFVEGERGTCPIVGSLVASGGNRPAARAMLHPRHNILEILDSTDFRLFVVLPTIFRTSTLSVETDCKWKTNGSYGNCSNVLNYSWEYEKLSPSEPIQWKHTITKQPIIPFS
jgi:hypothetical protein